MSIPSPVCSPSKCCPQAWRNQGGVPVNARSCKHLRSLLGDAYEDARLKLKNPDGPTNGGKKSASRKKGAVKGKSAPKASLGKRKKRDDDDADGDGEVGDDGDDADEDDDDDDDDAKKPRSKRARTSKPSSSRPQRSKGKKDSAADDSVSAPQLLLAQKWDLSNGVDPKGWWMSEKLDGVR